MEMTGIEEDKWKHTGLLRSRLRNVTLSPLPMFHRPKQVTIPRTRQTHEKYTAHFLERSGYMQYKKWKEEEREKEKNSKEGTKNEANKNDLAHNR